MTAVPGDDGGMAELELRRVRRQLDKLAALRLQSRLDSNASALYGALCERERQLLAHRAPAS